ncbi:hypothetical protein OIO90_003013 [Microbotryomycetes sp. JL221]|nr:hypothetical protein OIO90_003013 [Microbotryomycetes sp. JL221]
MSDNSIWRISNTNIVSTNTPNNLSNTINENESKVFHLDLSNLSFETISNTGDVVQDDKAIKVIGGLDISFFPSNVDQMNESVFESNENERTDLTDRPKPSASKGIAVLALLSFPELKLLHYVSKQVNLEKVPYIPSFLSFRESDILSSLISDNWNLLNDKGWVPDVLMVDGNGRLHVRQAGSAVAIGLQTGIPTIGIAKEFHPLPNLIQDDSTHLTTNQKRMKSITRQVLKNRGDFIWLKQNFIDNVCLGAAMLTSPSSESKRPVFVSSGHDISLETSLTLTLLTCLNARVPEPVRLADLIGEFLLLLFLVSFIL